MTGRDQQTRVVVAPAGAANVPTLETERLTLRGHRIEDFGDCTAMWSDPAVTRHIGGEPFTREDVWSRLLRYVGHWALMGFGFWVVREKASGRFVGEIGLAIFERDIEPSLDNTPEIGWVLAPWAHNKGFATEGARAAIAWFESLGSARTVCLIDPNNKPSIRVAEKCGYRSVLSTTYKGRPTILFERG
jgi:RimJ/RimL family protein N-acetyltransferase